MEVGIIPPETWSEYDLIPFVDRRKEVNMVKRTKGFGWTASGVSTALWRGVPITEMLRDWGFTGIPAGERWCAMHFYMVFCI